MRHPTRGSLCYFSWRAYMGKRTLWGEEMLVVVNKDVSYIGYPWQRYAKHVLVEALDSQISLTK